MELGHQKTTEEVVKSMREILAVKSKRKVAVLSILRRPRECINKKYEEERKKANREMQAELCKMKMNGMQVSFIDLDPVITDTMFMLPVGWCTSQQRRKRQNEWKNIDVDETKGD